MSSCSPVLSPGEWNHAGASLRVIDSVLREVVKRPLDKGTLILLRDHARASS